jgi:molybdate transport system permease protein
VAFIALPLIAIFTQGSLREGIRSPGAWTALKISFETSTISLALMIFFGTPIAYLLATTEFRGKTVTTTLFELPLVLPPAVAGIALLASLGPQGIFGGNGPQLVLTTAGVVVALTFVSAPFYIRQAQESFGAIDPRLMEASRTLGAGEARTFWRVAVPVARAGLLAGGALALGRALGEFGATLMFAGSFRGVTQTVPLAIYERFATDFTGALALSAVLVAVSGALLASVKLAGRRALG